MAHGDVGGSITELVITCVTPKTGPVNIWKGEPLRQTGGNFEVDNLLEDHDEIFGQALANVSENGASIPVKVRGIFVYPFASAAPVVSQDGITGSTENGKVMAALRSGAFGQGNVLSVDREKKEVHVLM